jgi:hypothetical protein
MRAKERCVGWALAAAAVAAGCGWRQPPPKPVATPAFVVTRTRFPLGSPVEVSYRFTVAPDAPAFAEDYRVFVHFLDSDDELMWTDDHLPPVATTQWKPGQTIEYSRTMFVPVYPYLGDVTVEMGLYSAASQGRLVLSGEDRGQRSYRVGKLELLPQTENVFVIFREGWHAIETAENNPAVEWQWTKREATLSVRNPKRDVLFYLHLDNPGDVFAEPQAVDVTLDGRSIDSFTLHPHEELLRKVPLTAAQLGSAELVDLKIHVDKTVVPATVPGSRSTDVRELGVRVLHAFVEPRG